MVLPKCVFVLLCFQKLDALFVQHKPVLQESLEFEGNVVHYGLKGSISLFKFFKDAAIDVAVKVKTLRTIE